MLDRLTVLLVPALLAPGDSAGAHLRKSGDHCHKRAAATFTEERATIERPGLPAQ